MGEIEMKQWRGIWFPPEEKHLIDWMKQVNKVVNGKPAYQYHKYDTALKLCKQRRRAIDVGGNIGLWSMHMTNDFKVVEAFEPVSRYAAIFLKNAPDAFLHRVALGEQNGTVAMVKCTPDSCGDTRPWVEGDPLDAVVEMSASLMTLDSYDFDEVDFIKIDCEGFELQVLRGALETIMRNKPVIIIEQKPGHGKSFGYDDTAGVDYLRALGMKVHCVISGDYVMVW